MSLADLELKPRYETGPDDLINDFYVPVLKEATRYDRMAGFFTSISLAMVAEGLIEFVEKDGTIRLLVNTHLDEQDQKVLAGEVDAPTEPLREIFDPELADDRVQEVRWKVLAWLLENDKLEIKICTVSDNQSGIFHPKLGILYDDENVVTFEGSNNETLGGLAENYDRFKVAASWHVGHQEFIENDIADFEAIWNESHDHVQTYDLPEAFEEGIVEKLPNDKQELIEEAEEVLPERVKVKPGPEAELAHRLEVLDNAGKAVGGAHVAETASTVTPWPHQRIVADTLYSTYPKGFLLCDEVGLGKTIEAGLTISRLIHTEEIQSCLILAPANLTTQWQEELWEKFNLNTYLYDRSGGQYVFRDARGREQTARESVSHEEYAWSESDVWRFVHEKNANGEPAIVIASWHLARMERHQETFVPTENGKVRTVNEIPASCRGRSKEDREGVWDLMIVDEAHKARRRDFTNIGAQREGSPNNLLSLLRDFDQHTHSSYLLTATPMQIHPVELYDLLSLVGMPEAWDDARGFLRFFESRQAVSEVLENPGQGFTGETRFNDGSLEKQQTLATSDDILTQVGQVLGIERPAARRRVLEACRMVRAYDEAQGGVYPADVTEAITNSSDRRELRYLLRAEDQYPGISSRRKREQAADNLSVDGWAVLLKAFEEATPVDVTLHRNTRDVLREYHRLGLLGTDDRVPHREVRPVELDLGQASEAYEHIEEYVQEFHRKAMDSDDEHIRATGFVMTVYRQRMTSSFHAIKRSLENRLANLREAKSHLEGMSERQASLIEEFADIERIDEDLSPDEATEVYEDISEIDSLVGVNPDDIEGSLQHITAEIDELESFIDIVQEVITTEDPKLSQLQEDIRDINEHGRDRVMIFTQYGDTLEMIRESLVPTFGSMVGCYSGQGGEMYLDEEWRRVGKERVKQEFSNDDGQIEILVCTESASHGLNLQKCGVIINYDLPWNPMRVEQRIGRIDRIGQRYDPIWIYNYYYEETIEMEAYDVLQDRVGMFEEYIGGMQPIFTNVESAIERAAMEGEDVEIDDEEDESHKYIRSLMDYETVEDALLNGWDGIRHPDIGEISPDPEYPNRLTLDTQFVQETIDQLQDRDDRGISLQPVEAMDSSELHLLQIDMDSKWREIANHIETPSPDTLAESYFSRNEDILEYLITFDPQIKDQFPSVPLIHLGEPLLYGILALSHQDAESVEDFPIYCLDRAQSECDTSDPWLVCGWENSCTEDEQGITVDLERVKDWAERKLTIESQIG